MDKAVVFFFLVQNIYLDIVRYRDQFLHDFRIIFLGIVMDNISQEGEQALLRKADTLKVMLGGYYLRRTVIVFKYRDFVFNDHIVTSV